MSTIKIFDVEMGQLIGIKNSSGVYTHLIDCGHNTTTDFKPSTHLKLNSISFIVSNFDEDHISDYKDIRQNIAKYYYSPGVSMDQILQIKSQNNNPSEDLKKLIYDIKEYNKNLYDNGVDFSLSFFWNKYSGNMNDTNNLSLCTFIEFDNEKWNICIPGDLEEKGWLNLLDSNSTSYDEESNECIHEKLKKTKLFVASHHGRESGYCEKVFQWCKPDLVIISDKSYKHGTQEGMVKKYAQHCKGANFTSGVTRYVLTTRNDGRIKIENSGNTYSLTIKDTSTN